MSLRELEKRLREEPANLGLRVTVAGALQEAGRHGEAVELYRSVAVMYRDQGRAQQALAVCRSILEIAPDDAGCKALMAELAAMAPPTRSSRPSRPSSIPPPRAASRQDFVADDPTPLPAPARHSSIDMTPLPPAEARTSSDRLSISEVLQLIEDRPTPANVAGIASAARRISASLGAVSFDDEPTMAPRAPSAPPERDTPVDDEVTIPTHDLPPPVPTPPPAPPQRSATRPPPPPPPRGQARPQTMPPPSSPAASILGTPFFVAVPPQRRGAVLGRFHRRTVRPNELVIRQGDVEPPFVIVARGRFAVRLETAERRLVVVAELAPGDFIGEVALLARVPANAHVVAASEGEMLVLPPRDFFEIAAAFPALWTFLTETAERRTRELQAIASRAST